MIDLWVARGDRIQASIAGSDQIGSLFDIVITTTFVPLSIDSLRTYNRCKDSSPQHANQAIAHLMRRYNKPTASSEGPKPR